MLVFAKKKSRCEMFNAVNCEGRKVKEGSVGQETTSPANVHAQFHAVQLKSTRMKCHMHVYKCKRKRNATQTHRRLCSQR